MSYTLWSRGRLIGHTDLGFIYRPGPIRVGWLHPTPEGESAVEIACGVSPALIAINGAESVETALADARAASDRCEALALELRGADGSAIPTISITMSDTAFLMALGDRRHDEDDAWYDQLSADERVELDAMCEQDRVMIEEMGGETEADATGDSWSPEPEFPRYQVFVELADPGSIP